jgi:hypothetical protein
VWLRKIENNKLTDPPILAEDVDKVRSIIAYNDSLTVDNNILKLLEEIKFDSTGKNNLSNDVTEYFEFFLKKIKKICSLNIV